MFFFFQAEDGIRDAQESRGLGDVYKRQGEKCADLIFHERNERGDDNGKTVHQQGRYLVADGFSCACGHYSQHIVPAENIIDDIFLTLTEAVVTENFFEQAVFIHNVHLRFYL